MAKHRRRWTDAQMDRLESGCGGGAARSPSRRMERACRVDLGDCLVARRACVRDAVAKNARSNG